MITKGYMTQMFPLSVFEPSYLVLPLISCRFSEAAQFIPLIMTKHPLGRIKR